MDEITVGWDDFEETYIVRQNGTFIRDDESLTLALEFALAVGDANDQRVVVTSMCGT